LVGGEYYIAFLELVKPLAKFIRWLVDQVISTELSLRRIHL